MFDARFLRIGIHPGGGHTWLLDRAAGPQTTAAMDLFGERLDGARAAAIGLAWECVADDALLDRALALAARAAEVPRELAIRTKATIRHTAGARRARRRDALRARPPGLVAAGEPRPGRRRDPALASPAVTTNDLAEPIEAIPVETTTANPLDDGRRVDRGRRRRGRSSASGSGPAGSTRRSAAPSTGTCNDNAGEVFADPNVRAVPGRRCRPSTRSTSLPNPLGTDRHGERQPRRRLRVLGHQDAAARDRARLVRARASTALAGQLASDAGAEIVEQTKPIPLGDIVFKRFVYRKGDTYWRGAARAAEGPRSTRSS